MVRQMKLSFKSRSVPISAAFFLLALPLTSFSANPAAKGISIPPGTHIDVQLTTTLSSSANQRGDPFLAEIEQPIFAGGAEVIPAGSTLRGHVTFIRPPGRVKGKAQMRLVADSIMTKAGKHFVFAGQLGSSVGGLKVGNEGTVTGEGKSKKQAIKDSAIGAGAGAAVGVLADG
ncbi:MAG: hypothetical protein KGM47_00975, partial [Acidobacteriota bacterium]|nr:hypothetical protein [Acidobacteriota bacterium]